VLMVDFAWKGREVNIKLNLLAKSLRIFEHHKTAAETLKNLEFVTYDVTRSGVGLAWDFLFGYEDFRHGNWDVHWVDIKDPQPRPWWVQYVEDYDLWVKKLDDTDAINMYLHALPKTIEVWDLLAAHSQEGGKRIAFEQGSGMLRQQNYQVKCLVEMANSGRGWGCTVGFVNAPYFLTSDVGHELSKTHDIALVWQVRKDGLVSVGLRSIGDIDVSKVAKRWGGGGHKNSAGFELTHSQLQVMLKDILSANDEYRITRCVS